MDNNDKINLNKEIANEYNKIGKHEVGEDTTKYGEFVTSYFAWVPMSKQKENVEKLENITKKEKNKDKKRI